jgi:hypothetical protein
VLSCLTDATDPLYANCLSFVGDKQRVAALKGHKALAAYVKKVADEPGVKRWIAARPPNAKEKY